jgi:hypothetical protein
VSLHRNNLLGPSGSCWSPQKATARSWPYGSSSAPVCVAEPRLECHYDYSAHNSPSLLRHHQELYCPVLHTMCRLWTASSEGKPITTPDVVSDSTFDFAHFDISPKSSNSSKSFTSPFPPGDARDSRQNIQFLTVIARVPFSMSLPTLLHTPDVPDTRHEWHAISQQLSFDVEIEIGWSYLNTAVWFQAFLLFKFCPS